MGPAWPLLAGDGEPWLASSGQPVAQRHSMAGPVGMAGMAGMASSIDGRAILPGRQGAVRRRTERP